MLSSYLERQTQQQQAQQRLSQRYNQLSLLRIVLAGGFLFACYEYTMKAQGVYIYVAAMLIVAFLWLMRYHYLIGRQRDFANILAHINTQELAFLRGEGNAFADGAEYAKVPHQYAQDLDIFGQKSLFQHLNRTGTYIGKHTLAQWLQKQMGTPEILAQQEAVKELKGALDFRQQGQALAHLAADSAALHQELLAWAQAPVVAMPLAARIASFALPAVTIGIAGAWIWMEALRPTLFTFLSAMVMLNMGLLFAYMRQIRQEMLGADKVHRTIAHYGRILKRLERHNCESERLKDMQKALLVQGMPASTALKKLATHFAAIETVQNGMGAFLMNAFLLYHLHQLHALLRWKQHWALHIEKWLHVIGELEALSSLAHFAYNEPQYAFPTLCEQPFVAFEEMGHPLIHAQKRVCNSVEIPPFVILTGSNMSGKSTFLRTLGINMVLACVGAPVCARSARLHPMPLLASMRQTDSLADSESYFFAEVKRLHQMMQTLAQQQCFVLLDEILRGTNSDDKRSGTVGVIEKIIGLRALGVIATHDLEVCLTTERFPEQLSNQCFEVEMAQGELRFDYRLRPGICQNKSATFLMKKMGIIE